MSRLNAYPAEMTNTQPRQGNGTGLPPLICVVDDDESVRDAISTLLRSVGLDCRTFESGQDFMRSGLGTSADCLIVDLRMKGMSGLELQTSLAHAGSILPTIFISAHGDEDAKARAAAGGALGFLSKPFEERELLDHVNSALARRI